MGVFANQTRTIAYFTVRKRGNSQFWSQFWIIQMFYQFSKLWKYKREKSIFYLRKCSVIDTINLENVKPFLAGLGGDADGEDYNESLGGVSLTLCNPASLEPSLRNLHYTLPRGAYIVIPHPHQSQELLTSDFNKPYPDQDCPEESLLFSTKF